MVLGQNKRRSEESEHAAKRKKSSKVSPTELPKTIFEKFVCDAGMVLKNGKQANELSVDQAIFQRDLLLALKRHNDYPEVTEEFMTEFSNYIDDLDRFRWSLMPSITSTECENVRSGVQNSLVRLMLGIDILQPNLVSTLLEKLPEFTEDEGNIANSQISLPRLLLSQFRWLDRIVDSKALTTKIFEIISVSSVEVQRDIISFIPEVIDDQDSKQVTQELRDLLLENNQLTVAILDALSNLSLKPALLSEVRTSVLQTLPSVELEDLPIVVKFLLQTLSSEDALEVITELRLNLDFNSSFPPSSSSTPYGARKSVASTNSAPPRGTEALTLDAIKSAIRFQKSIADAWIKAIENVKSVGEHKVIDIFVLVILHFCGNRKKPVESLIRNKIRAGSFTEVLLQATFGGHAQVLREYFPTILSIAEILLRSPELPVSYFGCAMYKLAFCTFDPYCQQEIIGSLVTHIGSGFAGEVDASLDILEDLVESHLQKMSPFAIFVKGVLDYLDHLSMPQIRKLYSMLSVLAFKNPKDDGLIQDDIHIIIRKQLSSNNPKYKRMGIIGAIMVIKSLAQKSICSPEAPDSQPQSSIPDSVYQQVITLLQLVRTSSSKMSEAAGLFMDELASIIRKGKLDKKVELWISENVINDFQDDYVVDIDDKPPSKSSFLPMTLCHGLDKDNEGSIAINLLPLVTQEMGKNTTQTKEKSTQSKAVSPVCLPSHFRLLQTCEWRQHEGDLEGIDALLGCPVYLPKPEVFDKFDSLSQSEKEVTCSSLLYAINWFREVVNAFTSQTDPEMKSKVITRLENITQTQKMLEKCLARTPTFHPVPATFDIEDDNSIQGLFGTTTKKGGKKAAVKGKKKAASSDDTTVNESQLDTTVQTQKSPVQSKESGEVSSVDLSQQKFQLYFREFDLNIFTILNSGLITKAALNTELNTESSTTIQLQLPQLVFLLEDLSRKVDHALIASVTKKRTFLKPKGSQKVGFAHLDQLSAKSVATELVALVPALCSHLEGASVFYQTLLAENDGMIDGPGYNTEEAQTMSLCFQRLLQIMASLLSWNGFVMAENKPLLKECLSVLASRLKASDQEQAPFAELIKSSFQYLENFSNTVPTLTTAMSLVKLLVVLTEKGDRGQYNEKIGDLCKEFLKRAWLDSEGEREKGSKHNEMLQGLLRTYFTQCEDSLSCVEELATKAIPELLEATGKDAASEMYPTLTKHSFPVFYRIILVELVDYVKQLSLSKSSKESAQVMLDQLIRWNMAVRIFHIMVNLIKAYDNRANLVSILKYGRQFVDIFLRQGMPLLDKLFRSHREDVQSLLKNVQLSTRALHHMCGHSKIIKDVSLTKEVPLVKRCLEMFVYRVKEMLTVNKCLEAFWLGNLKNRDLQGEEILSQVSVEESEAGDDTDNDAESLPEDEDSEVEVPDEGKDEEKDEKSSEESYSESY